MKVKTLGLMAVLAGLAGATLTVDALAQTRTYRVTVNPEGRSDGYYKLDRTEAMIGSTPLVVWGELRP